MSDGNKLATTTKQDIVALQRWEGEGGRVLPHSNRDQSRNQHASSPTERVSTQRRRS